MKKLILLALILIPSLSFGAELFVSGTATCSSTYSGFSCSNTVDKDTETRWALNNEATGTWTYQLGTPAIINYIVMDHDLGNTEFTEFQFRGSNNGSDYDLLGTFETDSSTSTEAFVVDNTTEYEYYRIQQVSCTYRGGDSICGFDEIYGYYNEPIIDPTVSSTATSTTSMADIAFGIAIIIGLLSLALIGFVFNSINAKKPWAK